MGVGGVMGTDDRRVGKATRPAQKNAPASGRGGFSLRLPWRVGRYLPFFFAAGFAVDFVVFFETFFFAAAM